MNTTRTVFPTIIGASNGGGQTQTRLNQIQKGSVSQRSAMVGGQKEGLQADILPPEKKDSPIAHKTLKSLKKQETLALMNRQIIRLPALPKTEVPIAALLDAAGIINEEFKSQTLDMRASLPPAEVSTSLTSKLKLSINKKIAESVLPISAAKLRAYSIQRGTFDSSNLKKLSHSVDVSERQSICVWVAWRESIGGESITMRRKQNLGAFFDKQVGISAQTGGNGAQTSRTGNSPVRTANLYDTGKKYPTSSTLDDERVSGIDWSGGQSGETPVQEKKQDKFQVLKRELSPDFSDRDSASPPPSRLLASPQKKVLVLKKEEYFLHRVRTLGLRLRSGRHTVDDLPSNLRELSQYLETNHKNLLSMKSDPIVWRPEPVTLARKFPAKKVLVLDLDETLIHCTGDMKRRAEFEVEVEFVNDDGYMLKGLVNVRPGAKRFLQQVSREFEVVLFTASVKYYADRILRIIDPTKSYFSHYFYRESCAKTRSDRLIKDLSMFRNVPEDEIMLVDNTMYCSWLQPTCFVPIVDFETNKDDKELDKLAAFLLTLKDHPDHNSVLRDHFKLHCFRLANSLQEYFSSL